MRHRLYLEHSCQPQYLYLTKSNVEYGSAISSTRGIVFASFKSGHDGIGAWDNEQGEQGGNEDAADDG